MLRLNPRQQRVLTERFGLDGRQAEDARRGRRPSSGSPASASASSRRARCASCARSRRRSSSTSGRSSLTRAEVGPVLGLKAVDCTDGLHLALRRRGDATSRARSDARARASGRVAGRSPRASSARCRRARSGASRTSRSRSGSDPSAAWSAWLRSSSSTFSSGSRSSPATKSPSTASSVSPTGASRLVDARAAARTSCTCCTRQVGLVGDLLERRLAAEHRPERALGAVHLLQPLDDVHGHPDRARLVGERPRDRLADPPGRIGRELEAAAPVELLDSPDQPERALLDQVEEREPLVAVVLRDRDRRVGGSTGSSAASRRGRPARSASRAPPPAPPSAACGGPPRGGRAAARPSSTRPSRPEARGGRRSTTGGSTISIPRLSSSRKRASCSSGARSCASTSSARSCDTHRAGLLARLEQRSNLVLRQQAVDVNGRHCGTSCVVVTPLSHR